MEVFDVLTQNLMEYSLDLRVCCTQTTTDSLIKRSYQLEQVEGSNFPRFYCCMMQLLNYTISAVFTITINLSNHFRSWRHHQSNLKSIYNKPTVKPETLQWAKEFKQTQSRFKAERVMKRDSETKV